jgi:hypothetical protein
MAILYHHKQRGTLMIVSFALAGLGGVLIGLISLRAAGSAPAGAVAALGVLLVVILVLAWWFSSMTVDVTDDELRWHFGPGWNYRVARSDIEDAKIVRHPWWGGYGIRFAGTSRRTYIVGGRQVVQVRLKQGGWRRLGTDDPQGLFAALNSGGR